jgi:hypothetical protein
MECDFEEKKRDVSVNTEIFFSNFSKGYVYKKNLKKVFF